LVGQIRDYVFTSDISSDKTEL